MKFDFRGRARMIFASLGGILFLVMTAIFPEHPFSEESIILFMGIIASYVLGEGISGATVGDNLKRILSSQKFRALVAGILVALFKGFFPNFPVDDVSLTGIALTIMAFILGTGVESVVTENRARG